MHLAIRTNTLDPEHLCSSAAHGLEIRLCNYLLQRADEGVEWTQTVFVLRTTPQAGEWHYAVVEDQADVPLGRA